MGLMLYLDDAMKVLLWNGFIDDGYIDEDGNAELVRSELEQKCYMREPVDIVMCKDCKYRGKPEKCAIAYLVKQKDIPEFLIDNRGEWFCGDGVRKDPFDCGEDCELSLAERMNGGCQMCESR